MDTGQLWIGTIHSFCLDWILRPYGIYHPALQHGFRVIDAHESERRLAEHCQASQSRVSPFHCAYNYTSRGPELRGIDPGFQPAVMEVLGWYWEDLHANRQIDFEMILPEATSDEVKEFIDQMRPSCTPASGTSA